MKHAFNIYTTFFPYHKNNIGIAFFFNFHSVFKGVVEIRKLPIFFINILSYLRNIITINTIKNIVCTRKRESSAFFLKNRITSV